MFAAAQNINLRKTFKEMTDDEDRKANDLRRDWLCSHSEARCRRIFKDVTNARETVGKGRLQKSWDCLVPLLFENSQKHSKEIHMSK